LTPPPFRRTLVSTMPAGFDAAFAKVKQLVADFRANEKFYLSADYQEQEARHDFIDKFWLALGWDVNHETQKNPFEQEVKVERGLSLSASTGERDGVRCRSSQRRADYAFYLAPNFRDVKFYVEAKKPHGDIATADNYFQTLRYGWSSSTPVAVLHDFAQFEILDCRYRPHIDTALGQNLRKYHLSQYEDSEKFAEIYWLFSREAVANGSLEKFAATLPKKRGRSVQRGLIGTADQTIDDAFLEELDQFRDELARAFKNHNPKLDGDTLTELTQRTLDRLVFLRFLEDKHIEPQNRIAYFGDKGSAWQDFIAESRRLDGIYNGIVYKKHEILDAPGFKLDDDAFSGVCERLSHLNSPYDFNAIPIHILGSIYERFLGKVIVTTHKRARLEEKPEVRKAGGVYYTPEYIVRYIVENTVGKLIAGKSPGQIAEMRFADIACGSGSFLLGVYDLLIRHHTKFYNENPGKAKKGDVVERDDGLHLSLQKKREILLANIYGVDIDPQAVEVAQLSLYLKLLADETPGSARNYQLEFHETLLPTLNKNIVCGNSLIGTDILTGQLFASDEEKKLNPMDFEQRFPHIFSRGRGNESGSLRETATPLDFNLPGVPLHGAFSYKKKKMPKVAPPAASEFEGGFDAIVGNPPYDVMEKARGESSWPHYVLAGYGKQKSNYKSALGGKLNLFRFFVVRMLELVRSGGRVGMIIPMAMLADISCAATRRHLLFNTQNILADCFPQKDNASRRVFLDAKLSTAVITGTKSKTMPASDAQIQVKVYPWNKFEDESRECLLRFPDFSQLDPVNTPVPFVDTNQWAVCQKLLGLSSVVRLGEVSDFTVTRGEINQTIFREFISDNSSHARLLKGVEVARYGFNKELQQGHREWFDEKRFLKSNSAKPCVNERRIATQRITGVDEKLRIVATEMKPPAYFADSTNSIVIRKGSPYRLEYLLGLLNSKLFQWRFKLTSSNNNVGTNELESMPFCKINFDDPVDKAKHDRMVVLVEQMLAARKQLTGAQSDKDKDFYTNRCDGLDRQIDALVYDLYALTPAEIKIVEGAAK
jgi:Alw26I/Eco31I/Esp3I family type II restriction m6 adenine DNA methyltransferase